MVYSLKNSGYECIEIEENDTTEAPMSFGGKYNRSVFRANVCLFSGKVRGGSREGECNCQHPKLFEQS